MKASAKDWAAGVYQQGHLYMFPAQATGRFPYSVIDYPAMGGSYIPPVAAGGDWRHRLDARATPPAIRAWRSR